MHARVTLPDAGELERLADAAVEAARRGGEIVRAAARQAAPLRIDEKSAKDFVTEVDTASEKTILEYLAETFPEHGVLAEESATGWEAPRGYQWVVDPLDGTTNFIHGFPVYGVSVGLRLDGRVVAGAVYDPSREEMFRAARGRGATLDGKPLRASEASSMEAALLVTGFPFREHGRTSAYVETLEALMRATSGIRRPGAASLDMASVACGRMDGFFEVGLSPWDLAAGLLLVEEAGGVVTDLFGEPRVLETGDVVAAGPALHPALLAAMEPLRRATRP
jgi:myo-inositol-1(or 4)-monophosphatase